jgi:hypothetical protein
MPDSSSSPEQSEKDVAAPDDKDQPEQTRDLLVPKAGRLPGSEQRIPVKTLQHWIDLCA